MLELLSYSFMRHALLAAALASLACGVIGSFVVSRRLVFITGGIAHTAYAGVGLGYFFGFNPFVGAVLVSLLAGVGLGTLSDRLKQAPDTLIGIIWAVGMALGMVLVALTPGYAPDLLSYLFGSIMFVSLQDLWLMATLNASVLLVVWHQYKAFLAVSFDEEYSAVAGLPVRFLQVLMYALISLSVVLLIKVVGIILVIALLTIPAALAKMFVPSLKRMMLQASLWALAFTYGGMFLAYAVSSIYQVQVPAGVMMILLAGAVYGVALVGRKRIFRKS